MTITWRHPNPNDDRSTAPYTWHGWGTVHARRWSYAPPWGCTRWALPRVRYFRGGDEYYNDTLRLRAARGRRGRRRPRLPCRDAKSAPGREAVALRGITRRADWFQPVMHATVVQSTMQS